ncbi:thioredoxin family protein [Dielma fastidiosa]|uniref:Small redox-active disulfide protein 2 n=1 Tax=Dielma fastidiosa TaxID=1034346 RepID=A0A318KNP2_9FIRM|nr:thioredoxin family protein [Dielma fastidiosa]PXX79654.1 small redox-active disulfide protein 2 [Dielma fastidiosa]
MKLFKKKEEEKTCCNCNVDAIAEAEKLKSDKGIKILGSGCAKCQALEKAVRTAVEELALDYSIDHITDFAQIASYGVMSTPAIVVDGKVVAYGKVLSVTEVKDILKGI